MVAGRRRLVVTVGGKAAQAGRRLRRAGGSGGWAARGLSQGAQHWRGANFDLREYA